MEINKDTIKTPQRNEPEDHEPEEAPVINKENSQKEMVASEGFRISKEHGIEIHSGAYPVNELVGLVFQALKNPQVQNVLGINDNEKQNKPKKSGSYLG